MVLKCALVMRMRRAERMAFDAAAVRSQYAQHNKLQKMANKKQHKCGRHTAPIERSQSG